MCVHSKMHKKVTSFYKMEQFVCLFFKSVLVKEESREKSAAVQLYNTSGS